ncbi:MAG: beta-hydroxyacyl-ACP dehydratase [Planctomycetaceae bacterium]|jgi:3-hydroxyacyl-[acyl-carrier-protein] dehydratase|nr:beta-hydroxyacyl-ACP dehydratase [Planctomycetaceae bacterium]
MAKREFLVDPVLYNVDRSIFGIEHIRLYNSQRFEMEQLSGILYENFEDKSAVGYLDATESSFWVKGHMPDFPIMPGVIMCEAAAQLTGYFANKYKLIPNALLGLGGIDNARFRSAVKPGNKLVIQIKILHYKKILITSEFMGIVNDKIACEGTIKGIPVKNTT